jgi:hypothetical protein
MPKKIKKPITRKTKTKNKNVVNVKINIDNSRKTTARRTTASKPSNMQPFVNFPSHQPARIQLLEPKQQFSSPDLSKTMDEYQKQFRTYLETTDKSVKDMIEKYDDTLKKNIAPQKKEEESKPGASNVYADTQGETVFEEPISKKESVPVSQTPSGFETWGKSNQMQGNNLTVVQAQPLASNKLGESIKSNFFDKFEDDNEKTRKSYNKYREAYAELYGEGDKNFIDINSSVGRFKGYKSWDDLAETLKKQKKSNLFL